MSNDWWIKYATDNIVAPIKQELQTIVSTIKTLVNGIVGLMEKRVAELFTNLTGAINFINDPRTVLRSKIQEQVKIEDVKFFQIVKSIRDSEVKGLVKILDNYLERLDSIAIAIASLLGKKDIPIIESIEADLRSLLNGVKPDQPFPQSLTALFNEVTGTFHNILLELKITQTGDKNESKNKLDIAPGHFYDWLCCNTDLDKSLDDAKKKQQQRLRLAMMKVILSYIEDVEFSPAHFIAKAEENNDVKNGSGFPTSSASVETILRNGNGFLRAYAGLCAAAFDHIFVSSEPLQSGGNTNPADLYHELPLTLKMQRPDLANLAFQKPESSAFPNLEIDSEFLAMKIAHASANVTAGTVRTGITAIGNGVWEISPNNPPLVDTIASLVAIPIYEIEKAIIYDVLRRFRVYMYDGGFKENELAIAHASMQVPDFSGSDQGTEKTLTAVVAVTPNDRNLLEAARQVFKNKIPIDLDSAPQIDENDHVASHLYGVFKDALAVCYVANT